MAKKTMELALITSSDNSTSLTRSVEALHPLAFYAPGNIGRALRHVHTPADALACQVDSIARLCAVNGQEKVEAVLRLQLSSLQESIGVKNKLSDNLCDEIVAEIVDAYKQLTMADIHVIFRRARTGEYGEFYERISMPKVLSWFRRYFDERVQAAVERNESEAERYKNSYIGDDQRTGKTNFKRVVKAIKTPSISIKK